MRRLLMAFLVPAVAVIIPAQAQTNGQTEGSGLAGPESDAQVPQAQSQSGPNTVQAGVNALDPAPQVIDAASSAQARYAQALDQLATAKEDLQETSDELLAQRKAKGNVSLLETDPVLKAEIAPLKKAVEDAQKEVSMAEGSLRAYSLLRTSARRGGVQIIQVPEYRPDGVGSEPTEPVVGTPINFTSQSKPGKTKSEKIKSRKTPSLPEPSAVVPVPATPAGQTPDSSPQSDKPDSPPVDEHQGPQSEFKPQG